MIFRLGIVVCDSVSAISPHTKNIDWAFWFCRPSLSLSLSFGFFHHFRLLWRRMCDEAKPKWSHSHTHAHILYEILLNSPPAYAWVHACVRQKEKKNCFCLINKLWYGWNDRISTLHVHIHTQWHTHKGIHMNVCHFFCATATNLSKILLAELLAKRPFLHGRARVHFRVENWPKVFLIIFIETCFFFGASMAFDKMAWNQIQIKILSFDYIDATVSFPWFRCVACHPHDSWACMCYIQCEEAQMKEERTVGIVMELTCKFRDKWTHQISLLLNACGFDECVLVCLHIALR